MENQVASILKEYKKGKKMVVNSNVKDFVEILLSLDEKLDDATIKSLLVDMLGGGDTTAIGLEWALAEVIHHPEIMKRAQEELDRVVGRNRRVHESDLPNLPYLHAIVQETFRLHPPSPVTIAHVNVTDAQILKYKIPANTNVVVNIWAIGRDPKVWDKPLEFIPDRFLNTNISLAGSNYNLLPFGSGRRRCPGLELGQLMMHCGLTTLIQAFDWSPQLGVKPEDLNMKELFKGFCVKADPLIVIAKPRLPPQFYKHSVGD
jgi:cytochrome P450